MSWALDCANEDRTKLKNGFSITLIGLNSWREAVSRSHTAAQLAMALYLLESCVAWDKSIMKAVSVNHPNRKEIISFN